MALDLPYKLQTSFIIKLLPLTREYQYIDIQSLTYQITLEPLLINFNCLLQYIRKSIQRRYKLSLRTDDSIEEIITITIITIATVATPYVNITDRDYTALYIIRKDITYGNILKRSKKNLRLSLKISLKTTSRNKWNNIFQITKAIIIRIIVRIIRLLIYLMLQQLIQTPALHWARITRPQYTILYIVKTNRKIRPLQLQNQLIEYIDTQSQPLIL